MKWIVIAWITATVCSAACGQATTQPSDPQAAWQQTVNDFASNLTNNDATLVEPLLANSAAIRSFDSEASKSLRDLLSFGSDCSALGVHAYLKMPTELAADMAQDFKDVGDLDEKLRKQMIPTEAGMTRANATASQWLMKTLAVAKDQPVGVIVLRSAQTLKDPNIENRGAQFVLVKGEPVKGETVAGRFRIKQIVFGDPLAPTR